VPVDVLLNLPNTRVIIPIVAISWEMSNGTLVFRLQHDFSRPRMHPEPQIMYNEQKAVAGSIDSGHESFCNNGVG
jgi:hypothetical protein